MNKHPGFSLLELAIVLLIMSLLLGVGVSSVTALRTNLGISSTRAKQHIIKEALITFISRNQRLPCPARETLASGDVRYGVESGGGPDYCDATTEVAAGAIQRGVVPWVSLGLSDADALDGWNNRFSYFVAVQPEPANPTLNPTLNPTPANPLSGMRGGIRLHSGTPANPGLAPGGNQINACNAAGGNDCNIAAVALFISHGTNGSGAFTPNGTQLDPPLATAVMELENTDTADRSFVQTQYSADEANPFDDIVLAITPADLLGPLERNNSIPSALGVTNEASSRLREALIASIVNTASQIPPGSAPVPPAPPVPRPRDGWGTTLIYTRVNSDVCEAIVGSTAFEITSRNIDLLPNPHGLNDDIVYPQSNDQLKTIILALGRPCFVVVPPPP